MHEPRVFEGYWWLPEDPDNKVPGTLEFSQDQIRLRLLGTFHELRSGPIELDDVPRILGLAKDHRTRTTRITLENNDGLEPGFASPGFWTAVYGPNTVLIGAWYDAGEAIVFDGSPFDTPTSIRGRWPRGSNIRCTSTRARRP